MSTAIAISGLSKKYGSKLVLRDVSLTVGAGRIYGFLGPNGAGKTTTIRCLMDFIRPDAGSLQVLGLDSRRQSVEIKRQVGYMAADDHLYSGWSARQHLDFIEHYWGKLDYGRQLIQRLELDPRTPAQHLSTGNRQKLGLILALAHRPKLLVLDEPTRGLDPLFQHEIHSILSEYREAGGTVFISSHDLSEVERICDDVGIIKDGSMVASESLADLKAIKTHIITATFAVPVKSDEFKMPQVSVEQIAPAQLRLKVKGELTPLIKQLGLHKLTDLDVSHQSLEELFMDYYRSK